MSSNLSNFSKDDSLVYFILSYIFVSQQSCTSMYTCFLYTVEPVLSGHSKIVKKDCMANGSLVKVESIAECSPSTILQYF